VPFGLKKVEISGPPPSNAPRNGFPPHPYPYVKPHINNRYIGNFMDKRKETRKRQEISGPIQRWFIIRGCSATAPVSYPAFIEEPPQ
jgi:hypothetical protein